MNNTQRWIIIFSIVLIAFSVFIFAINGRYGHTMYFYYLDRWTGKIHEAVIINDSYNPKGMRLSEALKGPVIKNPLNDRIYNQTKDEQ